jgi:UDPglucose 6-dehydrogenase
MLPNVVFHRTELELAEFFKYSVNSLIAVVVSYANGLYDGCQAIGLDYTELVRLLRLDPRLAGCPLDVPGPDGRRGWGGSCLPKDTSALSKWAEEQQDLARTLAIMLAATWSVNRIIRPDDGWDCITTAQKQRKTPAAPPP